MTRMEQLYSMRMKELVAIAEELGIKVNKKGKNSVAAEKIYAEEQRRGLETYKEPDNVLEDPTLEHVQEVTVEKVETTKNADKQQKKQKNSKATFEELVARIPAPGNIRFIKAANGDVLVKRGNKRIFRYNGHCMIATSEKMFVGCEYEKQNWNGWVIHNATPEAMKRVFKNA